MDAEPEVESDARECSNCRSYTCCAERNLAGARRGRAAYFRRFITDYELIRAAEGRGSDRLSTIWHLPYRDLSGQNSDQWAITGTHLPPIERRILPPFAMHCGRKSPHSRSGCRQWLDELSPRSWQGTSPVAVDLLTNDQDGLGAATHLLAAFRRSSSRPGGARSSALSTIALRSGHLQCFVSLLGELRDEPLRKRCGVHGPAALIVIADTPWYSRDEERPEDARASGGPLYSAIWIPVRRDSKPRIPDRSRLDVVAQTASRLNGSSTRPFYGIRWLLRPLLAKLRRRRSPRDSGSTPPRCLNDHPLSSSRHPASQPPAASCCPRARRCARRPRGIRDRRWQSRGRSD